MSLDCLFCKIIDGQIPAATLFEDDVCVVFNDIAPQAPSHVLVIPKKHIASLDAAADGDNAILGHLLLTAAKIARDKGFAENGYRVVVNTNDAGGQTVFHLHIHLLGGRQFTFPPG